MILITLIGIIILVVFLIIWAFFHETEYRFKVYCKNCKWNYAYVFGDERCKKLKQIFPEAGGYNTLNSCDKYKCKWWKFWV